jgi:tetratricopeptide (TPR) repeat protein
MSENVQEKVVEAYQIAAKGSFDHARMILEETLYDHPNSIEAWLLLADLAEDRDEALQCYQMVLEINPTDWVAQQRLKLLFSKSSESELVSKLPGTEVEEVEEMEEDVNPEAFFEELMREDDKDDGNKPTLRESFEAHRKLVLSVGGGVLALLFVGAVTWVLSVGYFAMKAGYIVLGS